jgi:uncharacterized iron-regulated protein
MHEPPLARRCSIAAMHRILVVAILAAACGGAPRPGPNKPDPLVAKGGLDAAALPYEILERRGTQVDEPVFWDRLAKASAVCVGEEHPNPHHHWVQLHVVRELAKRLGDRKLALGLEMVQQPFQGPLDDYAAKRIDAEALRSRTGWAERWGYDFGYYGPTLDAAVAAGGVLLALNAPRELVKKVARQGLESLSADEKAQVPELVLDDVAHRAWFDGLMEGLGGTSGHSSKGDNPHGGGEGPSADRIYTAQVLWDETMADGAAQWLAANPSGQLVILAGNGHCHDSAIVGRMKRRGVGDVVSIRVVIDDGEGAVGNVLARPMNDFVVVLKLPHGIKQAAL